MKFFKYMLIAIFLLATPARAEDIAERIQKQYEAIKSFSAAFEQTLTNAASGEAQERSGSIDFKQPRYVLWKTEEPEPETLIVGEDAVWDYFPEEKSAYKYSKEEVLGSKTVLRFLSGEADLKEEFYIQEELAEKGAVKLTLIPQNPEPAMVEAVVWVDPNTALIGKVLVIDFYANKNLVELKDIVVNPDLPASLFRFEPPQGVEVYDNTR